MFEPSLYGSRQHFSICPRLASYTAAKPAAGNIEHRCLKLSELRAMRRAPRTPEVVVTYSVVEKPADLPCPLQWQIAVQQM